MQQLETPSDVHFNSAYVMAMQSILQHPIQTVSQVGEKRVPSFVKLKWFVYK